ncbi:MAG TPA: glutamate racemase, partial [Prolixibacteraceae bacterium]|nr:glutamate racemase [Prolixibacteraceae bacterium]
GCTHYPLLIDTIRKFLPESIAVINQGPVLADRLADYLLRHPDIDGRISRNGSTDFLTTESAEIFGSKASLFLGETVSATTISIK